jgi:hypothetical protein
MAPSFSLAAVRVVERFYRMYPHAGFTRVDITGVKSRWYTRKVAHVKRERLGKQDVTEVA